MAKSEPPKLALDEDVRPLLARLLRERGWNAKSVHEVGQLGVADADQLRWATADGRVLISHNAADFARLASDWVIEGRAHAGILLVKQGGVGPVLAMVCTALAHRPLSTQWMDQVVWA